MSTSFAFDDSTRCTTDPIINEGVYDEFIQTRDRFPHADKGLADLRYHPRPLFFVVLVIQFFTRVGFDIRRTPISLLSLGDLGWIQIANFIIAGLLALACAIGIRRAFAGSKGGTWGPLLIALYGLGLILAGTFHPDPGYGFPPGAPVGALPTMSGHATVHYAAFAILFTSLIAACFVFFRRFHAIGQNRWSIYSAATGIITPVLLVVGFTTNTILAITVLSVIAFGWLSVVAARLHAELQEDTYTTEGRSMEATFTEQS